MQRRFASAKRDLRSVYDAVREKGPSEIQFWFLALLVGIGAGLTALCFRWAISALQTLFYGTDDASILHSITAELPWYWICLLPVFGGFVVGWIFKLMTPDGRVRSVADVIEGAALHEGRVEKRAGLASGLASLITLSTGGSAGREGPVVHLAAVISSWVSTRIDASGITGRDLLGCAVAGAVSASFNAPIAGALFAMEVILRHFALHAFAPIVVASVAGTVVNRLAFGNVTEFILPTDNYFSFYQELPAFLLLGALCGGVAVAFMKAVFWSDDFGNLIERVFKIPTWARPMIAGALLGVIALAFPHIIGVGYGTTSAALSGHLLWHEAVIFTVLKIAAVSITMGGRMGGGIFSPSMMIGALTGLSFGIIATAIFPDNSGSETLYALAGMGAVAAAVLGAPISTTLIVFEMTGDWQTGLAVMVAVSISTAISSRLIDHSFFLTLLERRNIHLAAGPQAYLLSVHRVAQIMRPLDDDKSVREEALWALVEQGFYIDGNATLETAMPVFDRSRADYIPVVTLAGEDQPPELWGALFHVDALKAMNKALSDTAAEEHS
ncbi:MAG: chloride channel protein [Halocynthiibacter sp.]